MLSTVFSLPSISCGRTSRIPAASLKADLYRVGDISTPL